MGSTNSRNQYNDQDQLLGEREAFQHSIIEDTQSHQQESEENEQSDVSTTADVQEDLKASHEQLIVQHYEEECEFWQKISDDLSLPSLQQEISDNEGHWVKSNTVLQVSQEQEKEDGNLLSSQERCEQKKEGDVSPHSQVPPAQGTSGCSIFQSSDQISKDQEDLTLKVHNSPQQLDEETHLVEVKDGVIEEINGKTDPSLFSEAEQCVLRLRNMNDKLSSKVMLYVLTWGTKEKKSMTMNFYEYLLKGKGMSNKTIRSIFNRVQREKMTQDHTGSGFDVSLNFALIKCACENVAEISSDLWFTNGNTLEQTLFYLKVFRNNICHENSPLTLAEFMQKTEDLRDNLERCIKLAGERYSIDKLEIDQLVVEMNDDIGSFRDIPLAVFDIRNYDNKALFQERCKLLTTRGKEEILDGYKKFCNFNPIYFITGKEISVNIGTIFTPIEVFSDKKTASEEMDSKAIDYEQILAFESRAKGGSYKIKLIEGPAGSGKSTLTRKIMRDWTSGGKEVKDLASFDLLLYMECRDIHNTSFLQLLSALMPKTARRFRNNDMEACALSLKLLIIVDGLDEMNKSSTKLFKEILNLKQKYEIYLFCTTRPEKLEDCYKMIASGEETSCLKITGIPTTKREEFASKYHEELRRLGESQQETRGLVTYLRTNHQHLQEHLGLPLNLVLLTFLWTIAPERVNCVTTATELYFEIHKLTMEKLLLRLKTNEDIQHLPVHELQSKVESFVVNLCKRALIGLKNDEIMLSDESESFLKNTCSNVGLPSEDSLGAFLVHKIRWTSTGLLYKINYPHKGIQEFLSALFILLKLKDKGVPLDIKCFIKSDLQQLSCEGDFSTENDRSCNLFDIMFGGLRDACNGMQVDDEMNYHSGISPLPLRVRTSLRSFYRNFMQGPNFFVIMNILQEMYPGEKIQYHKFKETFIHLTGLLHMSSRNNINRDLVEGLITSLQRTGIKKREEWLDLMSNVKCDGIVADVIAERVPSITTENTTIKDTRVYSYLSLFQKRCPDSLNVDITATPGDVPCLETLLCLLCGYECKITSLEFHDEFQYPSHVSSSVDRAVQQVFQKCEVSDYRGAISQRFPTKIPKSVQKFRTGIANAKQFSELLRLLPSTLTVVPSIKRLVIHLSIGIDPSKLSSLPWGLHTHLYLSDIGPTSVEWACKAAKALMPDRMGFSIIAFPRCSLDVCGFEKLVTGFAAANIKVSSAICTSANIPFDSLQQVKNHTRATLKADFRVYPDQDIWKKW